MVTVTIVLSKATSITHYIITLRYTASRSNIQLGPLKDFLYVDVYLNYYKLQKLAYWFFVVFFCVNICRK